MEPILTSFGGYIFPYDDATGYDPQDVGIGKDGSIKAAQEISKLAKAKVLRTSISGDNSIALFTSGKAAYLVSGPWALADVKKAGFDYAIQPVPGFAGQDAGRAVHGRPGLHGRRATARTRTSRRSSSTTASTARRP